MQVITKTCDFSKEASDVDEKAKKELDRTPRIFDELCQKQEEKIVR
jgi:hypothetical protein